jgi:UDP-glucose 4-epimerase
MNLALGQRITLLELVDKINAILGTNIAPRHEAARTGDIKHSRADGSLARRLLAWEPEVDFDEGLRRTVAWYGERA